MKKLIPFIALIFSLTFTLRAQDSSEALQMTPEESADQITQEINATLSLSEEQQNATHKTWTEYYQQMEALKEKSNESRSRMRRRMQALEQTRNLKMKGILHEDQFVEYEDFLKEKKAKSKRGKKN